MSAKQLLVLLTAITAWAVMAQPAHSATRVDDRTWKWGEPIDNPPSADQISPQISTGANGRSLAVWLESDGTRNQIFASEFTVEGGWETHSPIETNAGSASGPQVAIDRNGIGLAVWSQGNSVWSRRHRDGEWAETLLVKTGAGQAGAAQFAFDSAGNALAVWSQTDGTRRRVWWSRLPANGIAWVTSPSPLDLNTGHASAVQIAVDANGNALAVWEQLEGTRTNVWGSRFSAGIWATAVALEMKTGDAFAPQVAFDPSGNAQVVWYQFENGFDHVFANRHTSGGQWLGAVQIDRAAGSASFPQVALDANGNALATWYQANGSRNDIWVNRATRENTWGRAELVETNDAGSAFAPQVSFDANGNGMVVWNQIGSDGFSRIWASRYTADGAWRRPKRIDREGMMVVNTGDAFQPQVVFEADGNAQAIWYQSDGNRTRISWSRYTPREWTASSPFVLPDSGDAFLPQVATCGDGTVLAVWEQSDRTRYNILSSRYADGLWSGPGTIETDDAGHSLEPMVGCDADGNAIAVWYEPVPGVVGGSNIWWNRFVAGTGWGSAEHLEHSDESIWPSPQVAVAKDGSAMAVWVQNDHGAASVWANHFLNGNWQGPQLLEHDDTVSAGSPELALGADGSAIAVWQHGLGRTNFVGWNRYAPGGSWGGGSVLESANPAYPQIVIDTDGNALAVSTQGTTERNIVSNHYIANGDRWEGPEPLETRAGAANFVRVALDPDGNAIAVWQQRDGARDRLAWSRRVGGTWSPGEFVETDGTGTVMNPDVAVDADGSAVAVWSERIGSHDDVWTSRYVVGRGWDRGRLLESVSGNSSHPRVNIDDEGTPSVVWEQQVDIASRARYVITASRFE